MSFVIVIKQNIRCMYSKSNQQTWLISTRNTRLVSKSNEKLTRKKSHSVGTVPIR